MERLWTPWRREFVVAGEHRVTGCFLCAYAADPSHDRDNLVLLRAERAFVLLNLYPYNTAHVLVAPYLHTGDLTTLDPAIAAELMHVTQRSVAAIERAYRPDAFNTGMNLGRSAGAGVPDHLHLHVVPRWNGDTNFMPLLAETKVLPESLAQTYERLEPYFRD